MSGRFTKNIPEFVYFSGNDTDEWKEGPWVKPKREGNRKFRLVEIIDGEEKPVMNVFVVIVSTEDGENYMTVYNSKPGLKQVKDDFFERTGNIYNKSDWGRCISYMIEEIQVK